MLPWPDCKRWERGRGDMRQRRWIGNRGLNASTFLHLRQQTAATGQLMLPLPEMGKKVEEKRWEGEGKKEREKKKNRKTWNWSSVVSNLFSALRRWRCAKRLIVTFFLYRIRIEIVSRTWSYSGFICCIKFIRSFKYFSNQDELSRRGMELWAVAGCHQKKSVHCLLRRHLCKGGMYHINQHIRGIKNNVKDAQINL